MCPWGRVKLSTVYSEGKVMVRSKRSNFQFHKCQQKGPLSDAVNRDMLKYPFELYDFFHPSYTEERNVV